MDNVTSKTILTSKTTSFLDAIITSQVAGLIMAVVVMAVFTIFLGHGPLYPVQVIGSIAFGESALNGFQLPALFAGLVTHQLVALAWGVVFGLIATQINISSVSSSAILGGDCCGCQHG